MRIEAGLQAWQEKIQKGLVWRDPARPEEFGSFVDRTKKDCTQALLTNI